MMSSMLTIPSRRLLATTGTPVMARDFINCWTSRMVVARVTLTTDFVITSFTFKR